MFLNIYKKEFKWNFVSLLIWTAVFMGFIFMYLPMTNLILEEMEELMKFVEKMPQFLLKMFNFEPEVFSKPEGIFGSEGMTFVYILSAVFAAGLAGNVFSKEFENKTIEYLLVKPVKRSTVFYAKSLMMFSYIGILTGIFTISLLSAFNIFIKIPYSENILYAFGLYTLSVLIFFSGMSTLISCITKKSTLNTSISIGITIFMYFGDSLGRSFESVNWLAKISIFNYIPLADTVINDRMYLMNSIIIMILGIIMYTIAYFIFDKSDIKG